MYSIISYSKIKCYNSFILKMEIILGVISSMAEVFHKSTVFDLKHHFTCVMQSSHFLFAITVKPLCEAENLFAILDQQD